MGNEAGWIIESFAIIGHFYLVFFNSLSDKYGCIPRPCFSVWQTCSANVGSYYSSSCFLPSLIQL